MRKIVLLLILVGTNVTASDMETSHTTKQPAEQLMELTAPLMQHENENCFCLTFSCAGIGISLACALCNLYGCCNCNVCCCR